MGGWGGTRQVSGTGLQVLFLFGQLFIFTRPFQFLMLFPPMVCPLLLWPFPEPASSGESSGTRQASPTTPVLCLGYQVHSESVTV